MAHSPKNPLIGMRNGVSPSCVALPAGPQPWLSTLAFLAHRLPTIPLEQWAQRMAQGQVLDESGQALAPNTPYLGGQRVYYWRAWDREPSIPFEARVLWQDAHLVVADKPPFLPVTPGGRYVQETLLVRLKQQLDLPELSPIHRIDRETSGLVLLSVQAHERDAYQALFRERRVDKVYEAIAGNHAGWHGPLTRRSHLMTCEQAFFKMREARPEENRTPNSETHIDMLAQQGPWARYQLRPVTGKRHQLRVHMMALGLPLVGDRFYPVVTHAPDAADDFHEPLRLLAQKLSFKDPITGAHRHFESQQTLAWPFTAAQ